MGTKVPAARGEVTITVRYDANQAPAVAYHREHGRLVVTFGPSEAGTQHLYEVLRREVVPVEPATSGAVVDSLLDADVDGGSSDLEDPAMLMAEDDSQPPYRTSGWQPRPVEGSAR